jgi:HK97 family phage prohead protease
VRKSTLRDLTVIRGSSASPALRTTPKDVRAAIAPHSTTTDTGDWDSGLYEKRLPNERAVLRQCYAWVDPDGDPDAKSSYKFPHHVVDETGDVSAASTVACSAGIGVLNGSRGGADIPDADRQGVYNHLARHLRDAEMEPPELNSRTASYPDVDDPDSEDWPTMVVRFSTFGDWYEVDSFWEGLFLERIAQGAFTKTIAERGKSVKVMFNHGMDWQIDQKVLGVPSVLEERDDAPYAEVPLLDTSYNRDLLPGIAHGAYGSSFMFHVLGESWNMEPPASEHNSVGIPERTITEVRLLEFGPVTWPANPNATTGIRSGTDWYVNRLRSRNDDLYAALSKRFDDFRAERGFRTSLDARTVNDEAANISTNAPDSVDEHHAGLSEHARGRLLACPFLTEMTDHGNTSGATR